jgi:methionyl-tRNA synthetase
MPALTPLQLVFLALAIIWSLFWKGIALWKSARNGQTAWFVCILLINTLGVLEIIYLSFFQKKKEA